MFAIFWVDIYLGYQLDVRWSVHTSANLIFHFSSKNGKRKYYLSLSYLPISSTEKKRKKENGQENRSFFHLSNFEVKFKSTKKMLTAKSDI